MYSGFYTQWERNVLTTCQFRLMTMINVLLLRSEHKTNVLFKRQILRQKTSLNIGLSSHKQETSPSMTAHLFPALVRRRVAETAGAPSRNDPGHMETTLRNP